jgi:aspartate beta-hydroxylase
MGFLYDHTATIVRRLYDSRVVGPPVLDPAQHFPDAGKFVSAWRAIRDEALGVAKHLDMVPRFHEIMPEQFSISANDQRDWRLFVLKAYGIEVPENMAACPTLAALVSSNPDVLSASISFVAPGKHIPSHRGPFRAVLRFYLVLTMPRLTDGRPAAVLRIGDIQHRLSEGEYLLWDDTYPHELWNESTEEVRAVLLLDVRRRIMPLDMAALSRVLIAFVRLGIRIRGIRS